MSQAKSEKYEDPRTGGRWVNKPKQLDRSVVRLIQHGGRVHFGIPRKLAEKLNWQRGQFVCVAIEGDILKIERLRIVVGDVPGGALYASKRSR